MFENLANTIDGAMEDSREKSLALTELEASSMWAHKALANSFRPRILTRQDPDHLVARVDKIPER